MVIANQLIPRGYFLPGKYLVDIRPADAFLRQQQIQMLRQAVRKHLSFIFARKSSVLVAALISWRNSSVVFVSILRPLKDICYNDTGFALFRQDRRRDA